MFVALAPGTILQNRYRVISRLDKPNAAGKGKGSMGAVYLAEAFHLRREYAIKQTYFGGDADLAKAFQREAALLANLEHPSLPGVIDYFLDGVDQFLVMKLIQGDDLDDVRIQHGGRLPVEMALNLADELLAVLDYLHSHKPPVIHRDIKPSNLKLTPNGQLMLLDFGIAKGTIGLMTQGDGSINAWTPDYAPPEQLESAGTEVRSDLYSFGATFYHLLTGEKPPQALKVRALHMSTGKPDPLRPIHGLNAEVPVAISEIFTQALSLDLEKRPASAKVLRQQLKGEKVSTGETTVVRKPKILSQAASSQQIPANKPGAGEHTHQTFTDIIRAAPPGSSITGGKLPEDADRAATLGVKRFFACAAGILVGGIMGFVVAMILALPLVLICAAMGNERAANTIATCIVVIAAIIGGVIGFIMAED